MGVLAFGEFEADPELFELRRGGAPVEISAKTFDLLLYLIQHRDRVVPKAELRERVWQAQALSASAIPTAILTLRKALGDASDSERHVATIRGRGYRFVAELKEVQPPLAGPEETPAARGEADSAAGGVRAVFVGRGPELASMAASFELCQAGKPQVVLLSGEPGIGKTRTAEEFARRARARGAVVLVGRCREGEGAPAFWPWVQILRSAFEFAGPGALESDYRRLAPVLVQMVPEIIEYFRHLEPAAPLEAEPARFRLFDAVTTLLRRAGSTQPVVVLVDDLHRADPASLQLLAFVARELRDARVLLLATYRDIDAQRDPPRLAIITELTRQEPSRSVQLRGLSATEVAEFVAASVVGGAPQAALARTLHEQSGGNPFFLTQLLHLLESERGGRGVATGATVPTRLPGGVREAIARQLDGLPDQTRETLSVAATVGREFPAIAVAEVLGLPAGAVLAALEPALHARMVFGIPERVGHFRFAHVLLRDTIYEGLTTLERARLHRSIADSLERHYADDLGPHAAELAFHFREAAQGDSTESALRYAALAGEWASARLAYEDAARHYRSALQILEQAGPGNLVRRCELLLALGEAEMHAGERDRARHSLYEAAAAAKRAENPELLARAALRLAPGFFTIEVGVLDTVLVNLLEDSIATIGVDDSALRAQLLARLAMAIGWSGDEERRSELTAEAIGIAERVGDPKSEAYALSARHGLLWGPERLPERVNLIRTMGELAMQAGDAELILLHLLFRITAAFERGDMAGVDRDIGTYVRLAEPLNRPQSLWYTRILRAARALMEGRFGDAARFAEDCLRIGGRVQDLNAVHSFGAHVGIHLWEQGRANEFVRIATEYLDRLPGTVAWEFARGMMRFEAGHYAAAKQDFERFALNEFAWIPRNEQWSIAACMTADLCHFLEDEQRAEVLYRQLLPGAELGCIIGFGIAYFGSVARRLGNLATAMRRWSDAETHHAFAVERERVIGATPWLGHALHDYALMVLGRNKRRDLTRASDLAAGAREIARDLGMVNLDRRLDLLEKQIQRKK